MRFFLPIQLFFTLLVVLQSPIVSMAQNAALQGTVTNQKGLPTSGVHIQLLEANLVQQTDENGSFAFQELSAKTYTLKASFVGYVTLEKTITLEANKTLQLSLELVESNVELKEIVVKGAFSQNERPVNIGKLPIRPLDLPQSVMTLDKTLLEAQQVLRISDVLMNTNGVYVMGTTGGYQEEIAGRGFAFGSSNTFKNGVRFFNGMISELSGLEKVEILKGSAAILYGNVAAGGVLNLVSKKPKFAKGGEISLRTGSWGLIKPSFDVFTGIGKAEKVAVRINGTYEQANSFRQGVSSARYYINPSMLFKLGKKTDWLIESDYLNDERTPDFGVGIINYKIVQLPREKFLGVPWSSFKSNQTSVTSTLTHYLNERWQVKFTGALRNYNTDLFANTRPNAGSLITAEGRWIRNIQRTTVKETYGLAQLDLIGNLNLAGMQHQLILGADSDHFTTQTTAYRQLARYDTINVFAPVNSQLRSDVPTLKEATLTTAPISRFGVYVQDLIHVTSYLKVLAGLRYSYQQTRSDVYTYATQKTTSTANFDGAFSPKLGIVLQPTQRNALFASYSNSFVLNTGVDVNGKALPPSLIDQFEVGAKNDFWAGKFSANITLYRILNSNLAQTSLANGNSNPNIRELAGSVKSDGLEIDLASKPLQGLSFTGGYSFNETKYVKSNTFIEGSLLRYNPRHTANMGFQYQIESGKWQGFQAGIVGVYIGQRYAGRSTRVTVANDAYQLVEIPSYVQVDLTLGYVKKHFALRGKLANIANVLSYNVHDDNSVNPIAPRNFSLSASYRF